jgi:hypothetical protein
MYKPSIRGTLTALATLALCGAGTFSASTVSASTVHPSTGHPSTGQASPAAACKSSTKGVTVVVDFGKLKKTSKVTVACDPTNPKTGLTALTGAGFTYSFDPKYPGLVCRIDALPNPCNGAPVTAYWAFWHAKRGGSWAFSKVGAGSYHPAPGSVEGWAFGHNRKPSIPPPS